MEYFWRARRVLVRLWFERPRVEVVEVEEWAEGAK